MISRLESVEANFNEDYSILELTRSHEDTVNWLFSKNLLKEKITCVRCFRNMMYKAKDSSKADRFRYRCADQSCRKTASIRTGSFFESSKLTLMEYTRIVFHYFLKNVSRTEVLKAISVDKNTITDIYSKMREYISHCVKAEEITYMLGDVVDDVDDINLGVEVDESLFSHLDGDQAWVLGIYDRRITEARAFVVENRSSTCLIPIIKENVIPGARIYTDGWLAYTGLADHGYDHRVVNHSVGFGEGFFTTNHIESVWSELKALTKHSQGSIIGSGFNKKEGIQHHIDVGIWRRRNKGRNLIEELCFVLNLLYP